MLRKPMVWILTVVVALWVVACAPQETAQTPAQAPIETVINRELATLEVEAKNQVTLKAKGQMLTFIEKRKFAQKPEELDLNIPVPTSDKYTYNMEITDNQVLITAAPQDDHLKAYSALVSVYEVNNQPEVLLVICENQQAGQPPVLPTLGPDRPTCGVGSVEI